MADKKFRLHWYAGPSAQIEIFSPERKKKNLYALKYNPPFRATIRPPIEKQTLRTEEISAINYQLDKLFAELDSRSKLLPLEKEKLNEINQKSLETMELLGNQLMALVIPSRIQADLREEIFLELGMDKRLLKYPWELMHDGGDFLCLKHALGRFVNGVESSIPFQSIPIVRLGTSLDKLSILIISVPRAQPRDNRSFKYLPWVEKETKDIFELVAAIDGVEARLLKGKKATYDEVFKAVNEDSYQIIHFSGHAFFDEKNPYESGLVLFDRDISAASITRYFSKNPPIICFINACETTKQPEEGWENRYDIFGLAQAFLNTEAYLLGSRWEINDKAASEFSKKFYGSLLNDGESIGMSILRARKVCKNEAPEDVFAWASYVYYGDPRVCFCRQ